MYYIYCNRDNYALHISKLLDQLKNGSLKELILDVRDNFLCCEVHYELKDTYLSIEDSILVTRLGNEFILIDCTKYDIHCTLSHYLNHKASLCDLIRTYGKDNLYPCTMFQNGIRPTLRVTL